jgi:chromosomal replication initiation ATPase DnaA
MKITDYEKISDKVYQIEGKLTAGEIAMLKREKCEAIFFDKKKKLSIPYIITIATTIFFNVKLDDLRSETRTNSLVNIRMMLSMVLLYKQRLTLRRVGSFINRDHSSISHYINRFNSLIVYEDIEKIYNDYITFLKKEGLL